MSKKSEKIGIYEDIQRYTGIAILKVLGGIVLTSFVVFLILQSKYPLFSSASTKDQQTSTNTSGSLKSTTIITPQHFLETASEIPYTDNEIDSLGSVKEKILLLEKMLTQHETFSTKKLLLDAYQLDHQYLKARSLFSQFTAEEKRNLNPKSEFLIFLQSFGQGSSNEYQHLKALFTNGIHQGIFSGDEINYYQSAFEIAEGNYTQAKTTLASLNNTDYQDYKTSILTAFQQYEGLQDVPSYYQDGLLALQLMNHGFYGLAKKLALPLITEHPNYILPYQILANSDFALGRKESALTYFQSLLKLDYQQKNTYLYHLGVLSYELGNPSQAVIYFSQITDHKVTLDGDRYLVLSYLALGEERKALISWQRLLAYPELKKSDFYSFFQAAFWMPYLKGESSSYLTKEPKLVQGYLTLCKRKLTTSEQEICKYGDLGYQLSTTTNKRQLLAQANHFAKKYQQSEFYLLLAEIFSESGHYQHAQENYLKALKLAPNNAARDYIKQLVIKLNAEHK